MICDPATLYPATSEEIRSDAVVYIAGPMRGLPGLNFAAFDHVAQVLRCVGCRVISPAEIDRQHGINPERPETTPANFDGLLRIILARDFVAILNQCDAIALLSGWQKSSGARAEVALGLALGFRFYIIGTKTAYLVPRRNVGVSLSGGFLNAATEAEGYLGPNEPVTMEDLGVA